MFFFFFSESLLYVAKSDLELTLPQFGLEVIVVCLSLIVLGLQMYTSMPGFSKISLKIHVPRDKKYLMLETSTLYISYVT